MLLMREKITDRTEDVVVEGVMFWDTQFLCRHRMLNMKEATVVMQVADRWTEIHLNSPNNS